jgi:hypothetical protein
MKPYYASWLGVNHITVLHTQDRIRANSDGFSEPLRHASGAWIRGNQVCDFFIAHSGRDEDVSYSLCHTVGVDFRVLTQAVDNFFKSRL